jgi:membrane protease YdiL (CAAX protease family)
VLVPLNHATFGPPTAALAAALVALLAANAWLARGRFARLLDGLEADPSRLTRFYLRVMASTWLIGLSVPLALIITPGLTAADLGWRAPTFDRWVYGLAGYTMALIVAGGMRRRRRVKAGHTMRPTRMIAIMPITPAQRWLAAGVSVTAGVVEEAVFRGLLITLGVGVFGLHPIDAAAISLLLFSLGHAYQGVSGVIGSAVLGFLFTFFYLATGSLLIPIILHIGQDLVAFLLTPRITSINIFKRI